jgi:hypothetical protein
MIDRFRSGPADNPPRAITRFTYKGQAVFYVSAPCCDFQSELYDAQGALLCHPDGGITGRGDGKCPDFASTKKDPIAIWQDTRSPGKPGTKGAATGGATPRTATVPPTAPPTTPKPAPTM